MYEERLKLIQYGILAFFLLIILRLFQIQVLNHGKYLAQARDQHWQVKDIPSKRGDIKTSDGYSVATTSTIYTLYIEPHLVKDSEKVIEELSKIITSKTKDDIRNSYFSATRWVMISNDLSLEQKMKIEENESIDIRALHFEEDYRRYYPEDRMLSQVLGFVGKDDDGRKLGYYGLEQYYDGDLVGQNGMSYLEQSASGNPILWGGEERIESIDGSTLLLTIDRNIQYFAERRLKEGVEKYGARSGTVIVVNPMTGAILSMANYPDYSPAIYELDIKDLDLAVRNSAISAVYEPGSVMKAITMASAVDLGLVTPETTMLDDGPKWYSGYKVDNWDGKHHGTETMTSILQHSNNIGISWVGMKIGGNSLMDYFKNFGFGTKLGIDLNGEESGLIYQSDGLKDIEVANAAFGQGLSVTPLQMVMSFASICNGGKLMQPYVVQKILSGSKETVAEPTVINRPISEKTSEVMTKMLTDAVSGGEAKFFVSKKYYVAGKTGTAQVPVRGGYDATRTNATFIGYFPTYKNFVMLVKLEEPTSPSGYASETAVPLWMNLAENIANYYGLAPDM